MKTYIRKVGKTLLFGLVILVIGLLVYMVMPKYQIQSVRVDNDYVLITRLNTVTGDITVTSEKVFRGIFDKYGKLKFTD